MILEKSIRVPQYIHQHLISYAPKNDEVDLHLHHLQDIILHEKYVRPYFRNFPSDDSTICKQTEMLKDIYESRVLDKKYLPSKTKPEIFRARKNALHLKPDETVDTNHRVPLKETAQFNLNRELKQALLRRSRTSYDNDKRAGVRVESGRFSFPCKDKTEINEYVLEVS